MIEATTIIAVRRDGQVAVAGDGQVTMGEAVIIKGNAKKVRRLHGGKIVCGFAGATADAFTLEERFEEKLKEHSGDIVRASIELAKAWRSDRILRRLEAMLVVANKEKTLILSGNGDVIEPERGVVAIGSGGHFAAAAARAYLDGSTFTAREIAEKALLIASDICVYTNDEIVVEVLE